MKYNDITTGIVNSFNGKDIQNRIPRFIRELPRRYGKPSNLPDESRLFVCVGHRNGISQWAEITTESNEKRLEIHGVWRSWQDGDRFHNPNVRWKRDTQYLNGAVFEGPDRLWALLATDQNTGGKCKSVTCGGLTAIRNHLQPTLTETLFPLS